MASKSGPSLFTLQTAMCVADNPPFGAGSVRQDEPFQKPARRLGLPAGVWLSWPIATQAFTTGQLTLDS